MKKQSHTFTLSRSRFFSVWMLQMMLNNSVMILCLPSLMISGTLKPLANDEKPSDDDILTPDMKKEKMILAIYR